MTSSAAESSGKTGMTAGMLLAGAVSLLALPSAVLTFTADFHSGEETISEESLDSLDPESPAAEFARPIPMRSLARGQLFHFTPAGTPNRPDRSVTVAVRVDPDAAQAISTRRPGDSKSEAEVSQLRIAPTAFNLGVSRGYRNFAQNLIPPTKDRVGGIPDLERFSIASGKSGEDPRFSPRIIVDERQGAGRAPRTFAGDSDNRVDVGGSYRVTDHLDVTAGVRYSQELERLVPPLTDGKQDSQAVYVGTQFRF